jgi:hypothetical protein
MKTKTVGPYTLLFVCVLISGGAAHLLDANMRSFIESVRRKAPVVYVGSVKEVRALQRTKFDIKAKAVTEDDRRVQMSLYEKLSAYLRAAR